MKWFFETKPDKCPNCGSQNIAEIIYGKALHFEKDEITGKSVLKASLIIEEKLKSGKYILGGCVYGDHFPVWRCKDCKAPIFKTE